MIEVAEHRRYTKRGAAIGLLVGVALGIISATNDTKPCGTVSNCEAEKGLDVIAVPLLGGVFAAVGAGIGAGISHDRLVYRAPAARKVALTPVVIRRGAGVAVSLR